MQNESVAVLGSGTMGAGIAQAALAAGYNVALYDVSEAALGRAQQHIASGLSKQGHAEHAANLRLATSLDDLAGATLVIEAVPELLDLKRDLFARVGAICEPPAIIASNTSSIPITTIASACPTPERAAGIHFFNPVHRMALVEVIRAAQTDDATVQRLLEFVARIGKTAVLARDTPGFIVNRVARPFYGEALRLLGEQVASHETIDAALQQAGGFPLGPFALMDLIGVDVNFAVTRSMYEQSFGEARYRPHLIQQQMVATGRLGRKTGRGFYHYDDRRPTTDDGNSQNAVTLPSVVFSSGTWAPGLAKLCEAAGLTLVEELPTTPDANLAAAFVVAGRDEGAPDQIIILDNTLPENVPIFVQCADVTASDYAALLRAPQRLVGFDGLFTVGAMTLVATPLLSDEARRAGDALARTLGRTPLWIADSPALIVPRVVAMLANEAAFAVGEGVADADAIDIAMRLGTNHPVGPLARAAQIGYDKIVAILDHLYAEYHEERYRVAPLLRRAVRIGRLA